jgi:hypothetical protein
MSSGQLQVRLADLPRHYPTLVTPAGTLLRLLRAAFMLFFQKNGSLLTLLHHGKVGSLPHKVQDLLHEVTV